MASTAHSDDLIPLNLPAWNEANLPNGFMGRAGMLGGKLVKGFNLAHWVDDDQIAIAENWRHWRSAWPGMHPVCLNQVHGVRVIPINNAGDSSRAAADGLVTAATGIALCIFTADCVPILMLDMENHVAGALHAGWRGTLGNIAREGIRAMEALGARGGRIRVALGPSIGLCCFEVDAVLAETFARDTPMQPDHVRAARTGKAYLDLRGILRQQFLNCGIDASRITLVGPCTKCASERYFSRRAAGGAITGLQMSFIGFEA